jgi:putative transposase
LKPERQRQLVDDVRRAWKVSNCRACAEIWMEPSTCHYRGKRRSQAALIGRIKEIAATRVWYGYRLIHVPVRRGAPHCVGRRRLVGR